MIVKLFIAPNSLTEYCINKDHQFQASRKQIDLNSVEVLIDTNEYRISSFINKDMEIFFVYNRKK